MITALLALALATQQGRGPEIMLGVDRDRVAPGDVITLTIRVTSTLPDPINVEMPSLVGFELESRSERTEVTAAGGGRTTVLELRLRATTPGEWRLGPISARQGVAFGVADPATVTIIGSGSPALSTSLNPRVARVVERASPPAALRDAGISVALSDSAVLVGEQVDIVTIAWLERGLRQQLRRAPNVVQPQLEGVWSYPQPVPGGIAASRQVNGRWFDLFVVHTIVFPLTPGPVALVPARLQYSVPVTFQFFSQEERYDLESAPGSLLALAPPAEGRDPGFGGAVGQGIVIALSVTPAAGRQGEAFSAEISVRGAGNVALWPQPQVLWPTGLRAYPEGATERSVVAAGRLTGTKTFRFLLVADSSGAFAIPPLRYPFYDPTARRHDIASAAGVQVVIAPRGERQVARAEPPPIRMDHRLPLAERARRSMPSWIWWGILLFPPVGAFALRFRRRPAVPSHAAAPTLGELEAAQRRLEEAVRAILGHVGEAREAAAELKDTGVPPDTAERVASLLNRFRAARFGGATVDLPGLLKDAEAVLKRLSFSGAARKRKVRRRSAELLLLFSLLGSAAAAQTSPEELYAAGAYHASAEGFAQRTVERPATPSQWFNLGAAQYRSGEDGAALASWTMAARLAPRDRSIRRALALVPPGSSVDPLALWLAPVTPAEFWLIGLAAWVAGWAGVLAQRRLTGRWLVMLAGALLLLGLGQVLQRWYERPVAVVGSSGTLWLSPHEMAPTVGEVARLDVVSLAEERGGWVQVEAAGAQRGWMRRVDVVPLPRP